jgi:zinc transport system ATP-binding protein
MNNILEVKGLSVSLGGREILNNVSLSVDAGEVVAIVGPNGAGKTTLLKAVLGIVPYSGEIFLSGKEIDLKDIGYVPQYFRFDPDFPITVDEFLTMSFPTPNKAKIISIMEETGITSLSGRMVGELSGGELQKVLIARSAIKEPKLWLLDEATSGIDMASASEFFDLIEKIRSKWGGGVVIISHEVDVVYRLADKVIGLNGTNVFEGEPKKAMLEKSLEKIYGKEFSFISKK